MKFCWYETRFGWRVKLQPEWRKGLRPACTHLDLVEYAA